MGRNLRDVGDLAERSGSRPAAVSWGTKHRFLWGSGEVLSETDAGRKRELLLHLLDVTRAEQTLASIRRDFLLPVRTLFGGKP